jgi:RimJ/RimL family protein N-acetyltransferase
MQAKCNYLLKPYTLANCKDAFTLICGWARAYNGDIANAFNATSKLSEYCRVVYSPDGKLMAVIYPDFNRFEKDVLIIHTVLSCAAVRAHRAQLVVFKQYVREMFETFNFRKVVLEFPSFARLNTRFAKSLGMVQEATLREEWNLDGKWFDILRFGLLKSEWRY